MTVSACSYAQDSSSFFNHIKVGYSKGFKVYGINENNFQLKDENFTSIVSVDVHIFKEHSIHGEFINQPMMKINSNDFPTEFDFIFYRYYYDAYIRSKGFLVGYKHSREWFENFETFSFIGTGRSYIEVREYYTDAQTNVVSTYDSKDTLNTFSLGLGIQYLLSNNLGFNVEAAVAVNSPVFKLGIVYKL